MGVFYRVTCRNSECRYSTELREGPGMMRFRWIKEKEIAIRNGDEEASDEIKALLNSGHGLECVATYSCPTCKEWKTIIHPYVLEKIRVSPYGSVREYSIHYLDDPPKCDKCGTELEFILNPRSSKNQCPKCGCKNMKVGAIGYYD